MRHAGYYAAALALGMGLFVSNLRAEQNTLLNGSMESGPGPLSEDPHNPASWTRFGAVAERSDEANLLPAGAGHALKAFGSEPQEGAYQEVPVVPGNAVRINCSMFTRASDKLGGDAQAGILLEFYRANNTLVGSSQVNLAMTASSPADTWIPVALGPFNAPTNAVKARMTCAWIWSGAASGSAFWDGCSLTINNGANLLVNPNFEIAGIGDNSPTGIDFWGGFNDQGKSQDFAFHGTSSLRIGMEDSFSGLFQSMKTLDGGDRILLKARVYNEVGTNGLQADARAGIKLEFFDPGAGTLPPPSENFEINQTDPQDVWIQVQIAASPLTVPTGATLARVVMIFAGDTNSTGAVFFDTAFAGTPAGANRLLNASFENGVGGFNGIDDWTEFGGGGATAQQSVEILPHSGLDFTVKATGPSFTGVYQEVPVTAGESFTASAFLQISSSAPLVGPALAGIKVEWKGGSIPGNVDITSGPSNNTITAASPKEQWIPLFIDYTMPAGSHAGTRFTCLGAAGSSVSGAAYFDACEAVVINLFNGADYDGDDDEDLFDFAAFQACYSGSGVTPPQWNCTVFDHNDDGDVDLADYQYFGPRLTGPL